MSTATSVMHSVGNTHSKSGALGQAPTRITGALGHLIGEFDTHHLVPLLHAMEYERDRRFIGRRRAATGA